MNVQNLRGEETVQRESDDCHNSFWASYSCHELWSITIKRDIIVVETQSWVAYIFHNFAYFILYITKSPVWNRGAGGFAIVAFKMICSDHSVTTAAW